MWHKKHTCAHKSNSVLDILINMTFTLSDKVFNETNLKDNTGMRVALCPCEASSCARNKNQKICSKIQT